MEFFSLWFKAAGLRRFLWTFVLWRMLGNREGKVETMAAVRLYAAGGIVPVAGTVPAEFQRALWAGVLCGSVFSEGDEMVAAVWDDNPQ